MWTDAPVAVVAGFFAVMGVVALARPGFVVGLFGAPAPTRDGRNEVRAVYGGFGLAVAAILVVALREPALRQGVLVCVAAALAGMAAGRVVSFAIDRGAGRMPLLFGAVELALAGMLLTVWMSERGATQDEAAVRAVETSYDEAWNRGDAGALAALLTEDALLVNPYGEVAVGREAFRTVIGGLLAGRFAGSRHHATIVRVQFVADDVALADGSAVLSDMPGGAAPIEHTFTDVLVLRDGRWQIAAIRAYVFAPAPR